ncbi:SDR family NAD(P)-dependent oxidoreductase [Candidatus Latescibacterota bacterium]
MDLNGKVSLVTGGTKGIGAATALKLAVSGSDVAILSRHDDESARSVKSAIEQKGQRCIKITADMAKPEDAVRAVNETVEGLGGIDVLIHNAGGAVPGSFTAVTPQAWYEAFDIHVHAAFHLGRTAVPYMKQRGEGAFVLVSSVAGIRGCPNAFAYNVVKGALLQFARAMARDLGDDNIRVNSVSPGIIRTDFHAAMTPEFEKNSLDNRIPIHRFGAPEEVAEVIKMLVVNDFITGENYVIDGGMTMRIV